MWAALCVAPFKPKIKRASVHRQEKVEHIFTEFSFDCWKGPQLEPEAINEDFRILPIFFLILSSFWERCELKIKVLKSTENM